MKTAEKYRDLIQKETSISDLILILYGSTVYGTKSSDLDVCFITDDWSKDFFEKIKKLTIQFHLDNNLRLDNEIAYEDKLMYSTSFVHSTLTELPFPFINGRYHIPQIEKNKEFLASEAMKKRLLLNILTVKREILLGNIKLVEEYSKIAWEKIINVVISYSQIKDFTADELLDKLYKDPYHDNCGEMYLGYKDNLPEKKNYLSETVYEYLDEMVMTKRLVKANNRYYLN